MRSYHVDHLYITTIPIFTFIGAPAFHVMGSKVAYNKYSRSGSGPGNGATWFTFIMLLVGIRMCQGGVTSNVMGTYSHR